MRASRVGSLLWLTLAALAGCAAEGSGGGDPAVPAVDGGPALVDGGSGGADGGSAPADGGGCNDKTPPKITGALADIGVPVGAKTGSRTITFDEDVTIAAGGITISPSTAFTVTPALPATGKTFTVAATELADGSDYVVEVVAAKTTDACGNALAANASGKFVSGCGSDKIAPTATSTTTAIAIPANATSVTYDLTFDEPVAIAAGGITASNGAVVTISPALPAQASTFTVTLGSVVDTESYDLTVHSAEVADRCDNGLAADLVVPVVGACVGNIAPTVTSWSGPRRFKTGASSHTFTFSEPVTIEAGGIGIDNGGTLAITPALPATASSFKVDVSGLADGTTYTLTAASVSIKDVCRQPLAANSEVKLVQCAGDTAPPKITSGAKLLSCNSPTTTYTLTFDEGVSLGANALAIGGGATITSVSPALPAISNTFTVALGNLTASHDLTIATGEVADECGNASTAVLTVNAGVGAATGTQQFDYSGAIVPFVVPSCPSITIEAWGAAGNANSSSTFAAGLGARMKGTFSALPSNELSILVGQRGGSSNSNGGGGGSFVVTSANAPVVIAGGGGGAGDADGAHKHGSIDTAGQSCLGGGVGGTNGNGGTKGAGFSGAGGGLLTSGEDGWTANTGGKSFLLGGAGGNAGYGVGGFGGGGNGSGVYIGGGGGGYSGGASCPNVGGGSVGAGGGSFNLGANQDNASGVNNADGKIVISWQ
jgi:hypothetical protein